MKSGEKHQFKLTLDTIQNSEKLTYNFNIKARGIE